MKLYLALAASTLAAAAPIAQAQDAGTVLVRARALYLDSANKDSTGLNLSVNNKAFPEVDISYFFSKSLAAELVLTYPQKHDLRAGGTVIGELKHLPPTLSLQYHFAGLPVRPYVGVGVNATFFSGVKLPAGVTIDKTSYGAAFGAGLDVPLGGWWLNVDVKKVGIKTDVKAGGTTLGTFKVDPLLVSVGLGTTF